MSRSANVLSVQALKDFKVVMANFAEEARNSSAGLTWSCAGCATGSSATSSVTGSRRSRSGRKS